MYNFSLQPQSVRANLSTWPQNLLSPASGIFDPNPITSPNPNSLTSIVTLTLNTYSIYNPKP